MQLSSDIFGWSSTQQTIKTKSINFRLLILSYAQFAIFGKESGNSFSTTFCVNFFLKNVPLLLNSYFVEHFFLQNNSTWFHYFANGGCNN